MSTGHPSLVVTDSHYERFVVSVDSGLRWAEKLSFERDDHVHLFRKEDMNAWIIFSVVFMVLIIIDNLVIFRKTKVLSMLAAALYTLFWICMAMCFCGWIYWSRGSSSAFNWMTGYLLEWMLSFDNLFVFHLIFQSYACPDELKHKPLFWGICGAVFFRLAFLFIGEWLMHAMFLAHILFGAFLVYTGWKAATSDEDEDDDPSQNPLVQWLSRRLPFVGAYDAKGSFFVKVPVNERGQAMLPCAQGGLEPIDSTEVRGYGTVDFNSASSQNAGTHTFQWRATMLFLVVVCLEVSDILFAVDSVSAIVAQVPDLFLAYTSAIFAMLGLRATFFVVDELVKLFTLLKYGVAAVLIFIGFKLMFSRLVHVPASIVFCLLFGILSFSMVSSVVYERYLKQKPQLDKANASA